MGPRINLFANEFANKVSKRIAGVGQAVHGSTLARATLHLVEIRVSQINGCGFCVDMHTKEAAAAGETSVRLNLVAAWREATVFTDAERAALALAEEGTRLADVHSGVTEDTWAAVRKYYDDDQVAALIMGIALINAFNRMNVIAGTPAGDYQPGMFG
ncbi:MAG TPA: carboxymuconolactone decarboxylase family protein [Actinophytocola sp.]|uniref:carboxymuconolactone decarboxylase family protein n=1 Tax=Actinophytocola sp. TaxID=1872138 RepID=UPI002DB73969|nr:carboxymuconolactone decarboxylase family protein [Actinophytocola sp.]HEU5473480.1 carboxymuconolactone decarboxylase family protein [Actinophytocola sp.]